MVAVLRQQRGQQAQTLGPVLLEDAPGPEVAEALLLAADQAIGVVGEIGADDRAVVAQEEPVVGWFHTPWNVDGPAPRSRADARIQMSVHELSDSRNIGCRDRGELGRHPLSSCQATTLH